MTFSAFGHCFKTKMKVQARNNNLLRKLTETQYGARPHTVQTTGLALCFSAREYACPVWSQCKHAKHVSMALNDHNGMSQANAYR